MVKGVKKESEELSEESEANSMEALYNDAEEDSMWVIISDWKQEVAKAKSKGKFPAGVRLIVASEPSAELLKRLSTTRYVAYWGPEDEEYWIALMKKEGAPPRPRHRDLSPRRNTPEILPLPDDPRQRRAILDSRIPPAKKDPVFSFGKH